MSDDEDHEPTPAQVEFQKRLEYTEDGLDAIDSHKPMANAIWLANHRDEGGLSATGADNIAKALIMAGYGKLSQEGPQEPRALPFPADGVPQSTDNPEQWNLDAGRIFQIPPSPLERIADALENIGPTITNAVSEAIIWNDNRNR